MDTIDKEKIDKMVELFSEALRLDKTELFILLTLLFDCKIANSDLAKLMQFSDGNSVAYHIRTMHKTGAIKRFTITPNWKQLGLPTEFVILAEAENEAQLLEIEKLHVSFVDDYVSREGEMMVIPMISGFVLLQNVYHCFGDKTMAIITGRATSDQDAAVFGKNYLVNLYPNVKLSLLINKYRTIGDFFIDEHAIAKLKEFLHINRTDDATDALGKLQDMKFEK